jgi:Fe-S cluster assembly protein SufD
MNAPLKTANPKLDLRDVSTFPTRRDEAWRYSDFRRAAPANIEVAPALVSPEPGGPFAAINGDELAFANGRTANGEAHAELILEGGVQRLRFVTDAHGGGWQAQVSVRVTAGAHATLLETYEGEGAAYVASASLSFVLEPGATLERIVLLVEPADAVSVSVAEVALAAGASFAQTVVATGAKLQRHETSVLHPGQGATLRMDGVYLLGGARHADLTTVVAHAGPAGTTNQLTKGLATDSGRAVFQGRIVVERGADQTDARMRHDALLLSDRAEIDAKPELQINADDVSCAHGNTVGALDAAALFYIQSRGIREAEAKALLTQAFVGEVLERIDHEAAREIVQAFVAERLEGLL